jgi:hypothetical protein
MLTIPLFDFIIRLSTKNGHLYNFSLHMHFHLKQQHQARTYLHLRLALRGLHVTPSVLKPPQIHAFKNNDGYEASEWRMRRDRKAAITALEIALVA